MLHSKLIDILSVLDKKEMKLLAKFIYSPVYNQHKEVTALFDYLIGLDKFTEENLDKQLVYKKLFPKTSYDDLRLRHVISYLLRVCEDCLSFIEYRKEENQNKINLLRAYRNRLLNKHFDNDLLLLKKATRGTAKKSANNYFSFAQINAEAFASSVAKEKPEVAYIEESDRALNYYFLLSKLKNGCRQLIYNAANFAQQDLIKEVLSVVEKGNLNGYPEIEIYYCAYRAFEYPQEFSFYKLFKDKLSAHALRLEQEELKELFGLSIAFCKKQIEAKHSNFVRELFEIYLHGLASEALLKNEKMSFETQKSIVDIGLQLNEISWVNDFITDSKQLTDKSIRDELFRLNSAKVQYAKENYMAGLNLINEERFKSTGILIEAQMLKLKILQKLNNNSQFKIENQKLKTWLKSLS